MNYLEQADKAQAEAELLHRSILQAPQLVPAKNRLTYRCGNRRRCTVLEAYQIPGRGVLFVFPRYKLSPGLNADESSEAGRAANTEDGQRHWKGHVGWLQEHNTYPVICDHLHSAVSSDRIERDLLDRRGTVIVEP